MARNRNQPRQSQTWATFARRNRGIGTVGLAQALPRGRRATGPGAKPGRGLNRGVPSSLWQILPKGFLDMLDKIILAIFVSSSLAVSPNVRETKALAADTVPDVVSNHTVKRADDGDIHPHFDSGTCCRGTLSELE